jgi:hypothetical protein
MQAVCDTLEQLLKEGILTRYAIGGATAAGFHGEPLATRDVDVFVFLDPPPGSLLVTLDPVFRRLNDYLAELPDFNFPAFREILSRHQLLNRWHQWANALGLNS